MNWQPHPIVLRLAAVGLLLLAITDTALVGQPWFEKLNGEATLALSVNRDRAFDIAMMLFTLAGTDTVLFVVALFTAPWLWKRAKRRDAMVLLSSCLAARMLGSLLKIVVGASRPLMKIPPWPLRQLDDFGYPGGHAIMSIVILGLTSIVVLRYGARTARRTIFAGTIWALILGVGLSRIYLGVHWLNDVVGGYLYGLVILLVACSYGKPATIRGLEPY